MVADQDDVCDLGRLERHDDPQCAGQVHDAQVVEEVSAEPVGQRGASPGG
jgi:hypothetical protein